MFCTTIWPRFLSFRENERLCGMNLRSGNESGFVFKAAFLLTLTTGTHTSQGLLRQSSFKGLWIAAGRASRTRLDPTALTITQLRALNLIERKAEETHFRPGGRFRSSAIILESRSVYPCPMALPPPIFIVHRTLCRWRLVLFPVKANGCACNMR
jgi:hypothetical protein